MKNECLSVAITKGYINEILFKISFMFLFSNFDVKPAKYLLFKLRLIKMFALEMVKVFYEIPA